MKTSLPLTISDKKTPLKVSYLRVGNASCPVQESPSVTPSSWPIHDRMGVQDKVGDVKIESNFEVGRSIGNPQYVRPRRFASGS